MYQLLKVGSDAEVFLKHMYTGEPMSAIGLIGGTKEKPLVIGMLGSEEFALQEDNVMAEVNIPPVNTASDFVYNMSLILDHLEWYVSGVDAQLDISPSRHFTANDLKHPQAKALGCEPDYCVWTQRENTIDRQHPILQSLRTAGGHIHKSYTFSDQDPELPQIELAVKADDLFLGVPSVLMDTDKQRKMLYGKAGAFRPKNYGHEYRVLSNFWLKSGPHMRWAFTQAQRAIDFLNVEENVVQLLEAGPLIQKAINEQDQSVAEMLCEQFGLAVL